LAGDKSYQGIRNPFIKHICHRNQRGESIFHPGKTDSVNQKRNYQGTVRGQLKPLISFLLTARQYGEVVLPDASTGQYPGTRQLAGQKAVTVQGGYGALFASHGTNFNEHYVCRGTRFIGAANLSPVTKQIAGTGAVSRYKLSRSQKAVTVQDFNCEQMSVSGCTNHYESVLSAGAKAKSVTNNLPILSVLGFRSFVLCKSTDNLSRLKDFRLHIIFRPVSHIVIKEETVTMSKA
jgi:hypothetical protein